MPWERSARVSLSFTPRSPESDQSPCLEPPRAASRPSELERRGGRCAGGSRALPMPHGVPGPGSSSAAERLDPSYGGSCRGFPRCAPPCGWQPAARRRTPDRTRQAATFFLEPGDVTNNGCCARRSRELVRRSRPRGEDRHTRRGSRKVPLPAGEVEEGVPGPGPTGPGRSRRVCSSQPRGAPGRRAARPPGRGCSPRTAAALRAPRPL